VPWSRSSSCPGALDHTPLFQVMLVRQNNSVGSLDLPRLRVEAAGEGLIRSNSIWSSIFAKMAR